jgi:hypothetical protein
VSDQPDKPKRPPLKRALIEDGTEEPAPEPWSFPPRFQKDPPRPPRPPRRKRKFKPRTTFWWDRQP